METMGGQNLGAWRFRCDNCQAELEFYSGCCPSCFSSGLIFPRFRRQSAASLPEPAAVTARDLIQSTCRTFRVSSCPGLVLGQGCMVLVYGPPGEGKTTLLLKLANDLQPCTFLPLEMRVGPLLASMCRRLEIIGDRIWFKEPSSQQRVFEISKDAGRALIVDSFTVSTLLPSDVHSMARSRNIIVLGSLQVTKAGQAAGSNAWLHMADVVLRVDELKWRIEKSRYQPSDLGGEIWCSEKMSTVSGAATQPASK